MPKFVEKNQGLDGSQITSGTVSLARLPSSLVTVNAGALSGTGLTTISASLLSGTLPILDGSLLLNIHTGALSAVHGNSNVIPLMTSANTPSGVVTASGFSVGSDPYKAFNRNSGDGWLVSSSSGWIQYDFGVSTLVYAYKIYANNSTGPHTFTFLGSDTGSFSGEEHTLDTQTSITDNGTVTGNLFNLSSPVSYRYYRLNITVGGGSNTSIAEIEMYGGATVAYLDVAQLYSQLQSFSAGINVTGGNLIVINNVIASGTLTLGTGAVAVSNAAGNLLASTLSGTIPNTVNIPTMSTTQLGGAKIDGITIINTSGTISAVISATSPNGFTDGMTLMGGF